MIPTRHVIEWNEQAPWVNRDQVEQDLLVSRVLVEIFSNSYLRTNLAFRGGTCLYKLHIDSSSRYSEDIDLVQIQAQPAGPTLDALRAVLDPWLGTPRRNFKEGRIVLLYPFHAAYPPHQKLRLKIEINTREHFTLLGHERKSFAVSSSWFEGEATITTYTLDELMGTKLRALYQRRKGRDLFDLSEALRQPGLDPDRVVKACLDYMDWAGHRVTRAQFESNLAAKLEMPDFAADIEPLLKTGHDWDIRSTADAVSSRLLARLPGEPWKGD